MIADINKIREITNAAKAKKENWKRKNTEKYIERELNRRIIAAAEQGFSNTGYLSFDSDEIDTEYLKKELNNHGYTFSFEYEYVFSSRLMVKW